MRRWRRRRRRWRRRYQFRARLVALFLAVVAATTTAMIDTSIGSKSSRSFLDDSFALRGDNFLGAPIELFVFDEAVSIGEPGSALFATVSFLPLKEKQKIIPNNRFETFPAAVQGGTMSLAIS